MGQHPSEFTSKPCLFLLLSLANMLEALTPGFQEDLCGCGDQIPGFLLSLFCPMWVASVNRTNLEGRTFDLFPVCCCPANPYHTRQTIRQKYAIDSNKLMDCVAVWFCTPCFIHQNCREIATRGGKDPAFTPSYD